MTRAVNGGYCTAGWMVDAALSFWLCVSGREALQSGF